MNRGHVLSLGRTRPRPQALAQKERGECAGHEVQSRRCQKRDPVSEARQRPADSGTENEAQPHGRSHQTHAAPAALFVRDVGDVGHGRRQRRGRHESRESARDVQQRQPGRDPEQRQADGVPEQAGDQDRLAPQAIGEVSPHGREQHARIAQQVIGQCRADLIEMGQAALPPVESGQHVEAFAVDEDAQLRRRLGRCIEAQPGRVAQRNARTLDHADEAQRARALLDHVGFGNAQSLRQLLVRRHGGCKPGLR